MRYLIIFSLAILSCTDVATVVPDMGPSSDLSCPDEKVCPTCPKITCNVPCMGDADCVQSTCAIATVPGICISQAPPHCYYR